MQTDYLIVGAGSAGATLAARLSAAGANVCLLEAGRDYRSADAPADMRSPNPANIIVQPDYSHLRYDALMARRTRAQEPRTYWRGRGVGGSSAINGQIAIRAMVEDFDEWVKDGAAGWDFNSVLPFFNRLENDLRFGDKPYHGSDGPIPIYRAPVSAWGPVDQALAESALGAGYPWSADHNAPHALGVSPYAINSHANEAGQQERVSTNDGYLEPARGRNHLRIIGDAMVDQVLFEGRRATGVSYLAGGERRTIHAGNVILAAGAVHSPAILMRSGIGPAAQLRSLGIAVRANLPVGESFQDHPGASFVVQLAPSAIPPAGFRHTNCCVRYSSGLADAGPGDMMIVAMNRLGDSIGRHVDGEAPVFGLITVWVNQCVSRGVLTLQSADPRIDPFIEENMLDDHSDRVRMRDGVRRCMELFNSDAFRAIGTVRPGGADWSALTTDEGIDHWALANIGDTQHGTSSCRMGHPDAATTVVDPECRVPGFEGLRVIDASVMPAVIRANTHLTTVMIAERMAEVMIRG